MRLRHARVVPAVLFILALILSPVGIARAQGARDSLRAGHAAYDRADFTNAARLLAAGLDPAAGPRDSLWISGVHKLTDALLELQRDTLAGLWLRWANRVAPGFAVDSNNFTPRVTSAILAARAALRPVGDDSLVETTWEFTGETSPGRGALRVQRGPVNFVGAAIDSVITALPGERTTLAAGIHTVRVAETGYRPVRVAREVLPGVTTNVRVRLVRIAPAPVVPPVAVNGTPATPATPVTVSGPTLSAGGGATCDALGAGTFCWGANGAGQLGAGTNEALVAPVLVAGTQVFVTVSMGTSHACALNRTGNAFCWGANAAGQLGSGQTTNSASPVAVAGTQVFQAIAVGAAHSCGLTAAGAVFCWGANTAGQLGTRTTTNSNIPVAVPLAAGLSFRSIVAAGGHTCALTAAGAAWCWGSNTNGELGIGTVANANTPTAVAGGVVFKALTAGTNHTCGLTREGAAHCWGSNANGQLGVGPMSASPRPAPVQDALVFQSLQAGEAHTCGITTTGATYCWGANRSGQLGNGQTADSPRPVVVAGGQTFVALAAGTAHSCGATAEGVVWCWGDNASSQLGQMAGRTSGAAVPIVTRTTARAGGTVLPVNAWNALRIPAPVRLERVWAAPGGAGGQYAVGERGTIVRSTDGATWTPMTSGSSLPLFTVWGASATDVFAGGESGTVLRFDGRAWTSVRSGDAGEAIYELWGTDASCVYGVGRHGLVVKFDGSRWRTIPSGTTQDLWGVWGASCNDVIAVGAAGTILRIDGTAARAMPSGTTQLLESVWGTSATNAIAVGDGGTVVRLLGAAWAAMPGVTTQSLLGVAGSSSTDVYAVGAGGTILRFNGSSWSALTSGSTQTLWSVVAAGDGSVYASGDAGTILKGTRGAAAIGASVREDFADGNYTAGPVWTPDSTAGVRLEVVGGEAHVARAGSRGITGTAGLTLAMLAPVTPATAIQFDVKVGASGVPNGCGLNCAAYPAVVRVRVRNNNQTESEAWYAFNDDGGRSQSLANVVIVARGDAPAGQWLRNQRFVIREALPRADSIIQVSLGGVGTDFDGWFDNLVFPAPVVEAPPPPPVQPVAPPQPAGPVLTTVVVTPDTATFVEAGATRRLAASGQDQSGAPMSLAQPVVWSSSDTAVALVTPTGLVMGVTNGTATIRARVGTVTGTATVTVRLPRGRPTRRPTRRPSP